MIVEIHIALFKWKKEYSTKEINSLLKKVRELGKQCKGIKKIYVGKNYHFMSKGFTHAAVIVGDSKKAIEKYRTHPIHKEIHQKVLEMHTDGLGIDFKDL